MVHLPTTFALWQDMADCVSRMEFHATLDGPVASGWSYRYDENGDLRWAQLADATGFVNITLAFQYDASGDLVTTLLNPHPDGGASERTRYTYEDGAPVLAEVDARSDGTVEQRTFTAWTEGNRTGSATDDDADGDVDRWTVVWTDGSGFGLEERVEHVQPDGDAEQRFAYDALGRLVRTSLDWDGDGWVDRTVWRGYDGAGRILWKDADNDGDGRPDTTATWTWWCR